MGLTVTKGTIPGAMTPVCNDCGVHLCWDVGEEEAESCRAFWDAWVCQDCNNGQRMSLKDWRDRAASAP